MALDRVMIALAVGDNGPVKRHGMVMSYLSEAEWGLGLHKIITRNTRPAYAFMFVNPKIIPLIKRHLGAIHRRSAILNTMGEPITHLIAAHGMYVDYWELGRALGMPFLAEEIQQARDTVMVLDGTQLGHEVFHYYATGIPARELVYDRYAIYTGLYTIGVSKNYATPDLFLADLGGLTGDLTGQVQTACTQTAAGATPSFLTNGHTLTLNSDVAPYGNFQNGRIVSYSGDATCISLTVANSGSVGGIVINDLNYLATGTLTADRGLVYGNVGGKDGTILVIKNCLFNAQSKRFAISFYPDGSAWRFSCYNCVALSLTPTGAYGAFQCFSTATNPNSGNIFENCIAYGCKYGFSGISKNYKLNNCASFAPVTADYYLTASLGVFAKCASSDTTGSAAALRSLTFANEFMSADPTLSTAFKVKYGGQCYNGGAAPIVTENTYGVRHNPRPHATSTYSIGADEYKQFIGAPAGIFG
jgi:hypothetical protein